MDQYEVIISLSMEHFTVSHSVSYSNYSIEDAIMLTECPFLQYEYIVGYFWNITGFQDTLYIIERGHVCAYSMCFMSLSFFCELTRMEKLTGYQSQVTCINRCMNKLMTKFNWSLHQMKWGVWAYRMLLISISLMFRWLQNKHC